MAKIIITRKARSWSGFPGEVVSIHESTNQSLKQGIKHGYLDYNSTSKTFFYQYCRCKREINSYNL